MKRYGRTPKRTTSAASAESAVVSKGLRSGISASSNFGVRGNPQRREEGEHREGADLRDLRVDPAKLGDLARADVVADRAGHHEEHGGGEAGGGHLEDRGL